MISSSQINFIKQRNERMLQLAQDGKPYSAIARELGCSNSTVSKELTKAGMGRYKPKGITLVAQKAEIVTKSPQLETSVEVSSQFEQFQAFQQFLAWQKGQGMQTFQSAPQAKPVKPKAKTSTFIFTAYEVRVKPDLQFLDCLKQLARYWNAETYLTLTTPEDVEFIPPSLSHLPVITSDLKINNNIYFRYKRTNALIQSVITPYKGVFQETAIIPGLGKEIETLPIPADEMHAKQIITTGSCGRLNAELTDYSHVAEEATQKRLSSRWAKTKDKKQGAQYSAAQARILPAALIVQVLSEKHFVTRFVTMKESGVLYDLNQKFEAGKDAPTLSQPLALNIGDTHAYVNDADTQLAIQDIAATLKPKAGILNDFFDGSSCNHHEIHDKVKVAKAPKLDDEAKMTRAMLDEVCTWFEEVHYLGSNHDNFVLSYLNNPGDWRDDDHYRCSKLNVFRHETGRHPIIDLLKLDEIENLQFIPEDKRLMIAGIANAHGHIGVSGAKPNFIALAKVFWNYCQGHTHSPRVWYEAVCVGLSAQLQQPYRKGASGWWMAHSLQQPDGTQQLLTTIGKKWRLV